MTKTPGKIQVPRDSLLILSRLGSRPILVLLTVAAIILVGSVTGIGTVTVLNIVNPKWGLYACICLLLCSLILVSGNVKHCLLFVAAFTIPLGIDFRVFARDSSRDVGIFLSSMDICALALMMLLLMKVLVNRDERIRWYPSTTIPWLLLVGAAGISIPNSLDKTTSVYFTITLFQQFILYFAVANSLRHEKDVRRTLVYLAAGLTLGASMYIVTAVTGINVNLVTGEVSHEGFSGYGNLVRSRGTFGYSIQAGQYFISAMWIPMALLLVRKGAVARVLLHLVFGVSVIACACTLSRTAYYSFFGGLLCYLICGYRAKIIKMSTVTFAVLLGCVFAATVGSAAWSRINVEDDGTWNGRTPLMKQARYIVGRHPIVGIGAGAYNDALYSYERPEAGDYWHHQVHNEYLLWWATCGTIGFAAFLYLIFKVANEARRLFRERSPAAKAVGMAMLCMLSSLLPSLYLEAGLLGARLSTPHLFAVLLGVVAAARAIEQQAKRTNPSVEAGSNVHEGSTLDSLATRTGV